MTWSISKATAYGGILLTRTGQILLREPANHYDGYVWTFAKGRPDPGDTPDQAALREVFEETGYRAEIVDVLPGVFQGGTTSNAYFVMRHISLQVKPDWETASTRWASFDEAEKLIGQTTNDKGRKRDLTILAAARRWFEKTRQWFFLMANQIPKSQQRRLSRLFQSPALKTLLAKQRNQTSLLAWSSATTTSRVR